MADMLDLKRWLDDCERNARKEGIPTSDILLAFLDETIGVLVDFKIEVLEKGVIDG